jgi:CheY-like chemotaxis protein
MLPQSVEDGPSALIAIRRAAKAESPFDLVLLDGHMPGLDGFGVAERVRKDPDLVCGSLIMLTSAGEQGESARCRELGVAGYLMKPVAASDLRRVIETVVKQLALPVPDEAAADTAPVAVDVPAPTPMPATVAPAEPAAPLIVGRQFRFLLAEDNPVNRTIGTRMLTKHGHVVVSVENGVQAVEITATEQFDVILMDVEMPVMNGFEATAAIRARDAQAGGRRTPIIALTAHTMQGDRERCIEAGMDSYATKPIQPTELFATVEALLNTYPPEVSMSSTPASSEAPVLDRTALYEQVGDEADLLLKVIEMFRNDSVQVVAKLETALANDDASEVQQGAHRVKGALLTLGAKAAAEVAMHLEHMGRAGDLTNGTARLAQLREELTRLAPELDAVVSGLDIRTAANL